MFFKNIIYKISCIPFLIRTFLEKEAVGIKMPNGNIKIYDYRRKSK